MASNEAREVTAAEEPGNDAAMIDVEEYETQFFEFTPQSFSDGIYNCMVSYIFEGFQKLQQDLLDAYPDLVTANQNQKASEIIFPKIMQTLDAVFDKLMVYLSSNIFCIPLHVLLPEDDMQHVSPMTKENEVALIEEINKLKQEVINTKFHNARLKQELQDLSVVQERWQSFIQTVKQNQQLLQDRGVTSLEELTTNLTAAISKTVESLDKLPK